MSLGSWAKVILGLKEVVLEILFHELLFVLESLDSFMKGLISHLDLLALQLFKLVNSDLLFIYADIADGVKAPYFMTLFELAFLIGILYKNSHYFSLIIT